MISLYFICLGWSDQKRQETAKIETPCFEINLPHTFYLINKQGIDSYVAEIRDANLIFSIDCGFGAYGLDDTAFDYIYKAYSVSFFYEILKKRSMDVSQYQINKYNNPLSIDSVVFFKRHEEGDFVNVYCNIADTIIDTITPLIPHGLIEQSFVLDLYNGFNRKIVYPNKKHRNEL